MYPQAQSCGKPRSDQRRLVVAALAPSIGMQRHGHDCRPPWPPVLRGGSEPGLHGPGEEVSKRPPQVGAAVELELADQMRELSLVYPKRYCTVVPTVRPLAGRAVNPAPRARLAAKGPALVASAVGGR